ncbi:MAG TPA: copper resistance protein CopC [Solirubrobacteraceae bacterium]|jgi:methionine-rich copper-binding protein CopC|nr:copper resistance protein CopC [Solirubrobacteraceae bacterium]
MTATRIRISTRLLAAALAVTCVIGAGVALGHAEVTSTSPKAGGTARTTLSRVTVRFGDPVTTGTITVTGPSGVVSRGRGGPDPRNPARLLAGLRRPLAPGAYKAAWTALATDGHRQRGSFTFKVRR